MWEQIVYLDGHKRLSQVASYLRERTRFEDRWISALRTSENLPLHLLWGNRDPTSTIEIAERLAHQIPGTELTRLFRVGHFPPIEAPAETANAITSWLDRVESAEAASSSPRRQAATHRAVPDAARAPQVGVCQRRIGRSERPARLSDACTEDRDGSRRGSGARL